MQFNQHEINSEVKKFFTAGGKLNDDTEKQFLGHVAWLVGNNGNGSNTDLLCQYERFYTDKELPMLDLSSGRGIFTSDLYYAFVMLKKDMSLPNFCPKEHEILTAGMAQDLSLVNRFIL